MVPFWPKPPKPLSRLPCTAGLLKEAVALAENQADLLEVVGLLVQHPQAALEMLGGRWGTGGDAAGSQDVNMAGASSQEEDGR